MLAGHSFGGLYVLAHAGRYPGGVAGMVLIDSTDPATKADPQKATGCDGDSHDAATDRVAALGAAAARIGSVRLVGSVCCDLPTDFGDKPMVVLTAGADTDATHDAAQNKLASLSTDSSHRVVEGASHIGLITDEQYAKATTQAILDVAASVRNNQPLAK